MDILAMLADELRDYGLIVDHKSDLGRLVVSHPTGRWMSLKAVIRLNGARLHAGWPFASDPFNLTCDLADAGTDLDCLVSMIAHRCGSTKRVNDNDNNDSMRDQLL